MTTELTPPAPGAIPVPARMLADSVYCLRLAHLEWVTGQFTDNLDTVLGTEVHRRVDQPRGKPPAPRNRNSAEVSSDDGTDAPPVDGESTSVWVTSDRLGLTAKLDVLEHRGDQVVPVDYKKGSPAPVDDPVRPEQRAQIAVQVMVLRDQGHDVPHGEVYFNATRTRSPVTVGPDEERFVLEQAERVRALLEEPTPPPPLVDSPKCPRCSLVGVCLPDETNVVAGRRNRKARLVARDDPASPLYALRQGTRLVKRSGRIALMDGREELASRRMLDVSHVAVFGNVDVSSAVVRACADDGVPVLWFSHGGWLRAQAGGALTGDVAVRIAQHRVAAEGGDPYAAAFVAGKIRNQRTLLRRNARSPADDVLERLKALAQQATAKSAVPSLMGIEGTAARLYFGAFSTMLSSNAHAEGFSFEGRNRRPPRDPVNVVLSFVYALLVRDVSVALTIAGFDPQVGLLHAPRFGRPSLALDLAEELRPLIGDSTVLTLLNNGELTERDVVRRAGAVALNDRGRRTVIAAYERRVTTELAHPHFGYKVTYRRAIELQARMLAAALVGDVPEYRPLTTR